MYILFDEIYRNIVYYNTSQYATVTILLYKNTINLLSDLLAHRECLFYLKSTKIELVTDA